MPSETIDQDTFFGDKTTRRRTAVVWAVLFGAGTTLLKKVGTRYLLNEKVRLEWSDLTTVVISGTVSYISFRRNHSGDAPFGD